MIDIIRELFAKKADKHKPDICTPTYTEIERAQIQRAYLKRWGDRAPEPDPDTHPWLFDPCDPPRGWSYDPYYEMWIKQTDT